MAEKKTMGKAKSNCVSTCSICGKPISAGIKYGIMDNEIYCPVCYNLWVMKRQADTRYIRQKRIKRTIVRTICFLIAVIGLVISFVMRDKSNEYLFVIAVVCSSLIACFPYHEAFVDFTLRGLNGFINGESTMQRNTPVYFRNGIIENQKIGVLRILFYIIDFISAFICVALLIICTLPRAVIDLVRIKKAKEKIEKNYDELLPPFDGNDNTRYDFDLVFKNSYSFICVDYYSYHFKVNRKTAEEELEKNLVKPLVHDATYFEGYKAFLPFYDGRRKRNGERFITFEVKLNPKSLDTVKHIPTGKRKNR